MSKVKVAAFSVSLDGFGAGPRQDLQNPLRVRGEELHSWFVDPDVFKKMNDQGEGSHGIDNDFAAQSMDNIGRLDFGAEYVRAGARSLERRVLEGLVGR